MSSAIDVRPQVECLKLDEWFQVWLPYAVADRLAGLATAAGETTAETVWRLVYRSYRHTLSDLRLAAARPTGDQGRAFTFAGDSHQVANIRRLAQGAGLKVGELIRAVVLLEGGQP